MQHKAQLKRFILCIAGLGLLVTAVSAGQARSAGGHQAYLPLVNNFQYPPTLQLVPFAQGFETEAITDIAHAGDDRLFVTERAGVIRVVLSNGTILPTPFLDIHHLVEIGNWEQGLLGLAFHPNYPQTPYFYIAYTTKIENRIRLARYTVSGDPNIADPNSALPLMTIEKTLFFNQRSPVHNGGDLNFGPDGYLYFGVGDGGPDPQFGSTDVHDPGNHGYSLNTILGKIIRIDVDGNGLPPQDPCSFEHNYTIPPDNPFSDGTGPHCDEIWDRGFRNPWRFSFDRLTGDMFIGDVGEWEREEINFEPAGSGGGFNYGWRCWEGTFDQTIPHPNIAPGCDPIELYTFPIHEYTRDMGCSVVGGFVYRGAAYPALRNHYVFGDFCNGRLRVLSPRGNGDWLRTVNQNIGFNLSTFGEDVNGEIYVGRWQAGNENNVLYRLVATSPAR